MKWWPVALLLICIAIITTLSSKQTSSTQTISTSGSCSPVVSKTGGSVIIRCSTFSPAQLEQINIAARESAATHDAVLRMIELLEQAAAPAEQRLAKAEAYAQQLNKMSKEIAKLNNDLATEKARQALQRGDLKVASVWLELASQMQIDNVVNTRYGQLFFGTQANDSFSPIVSFHNKFVHIPDGGDGESFRFYEEFGVKRLWLFDLILASRSLGGTACPQNYSLIAVFESELTFYQFGNCNEEIHWRYLGTETLEITIPRSGPSREDAAQKIIVRLLEGNLNVTRNGIKLD